MMAIFHDMIEKTMEVFMDDFLVFGDSFYSCLSNLEKMLKRCEDTNLVLNWEKCHFMYREGIVLGHKISKSGIKVDRAKVAVIAKLRSPRTTVIGQRKMKHFQTIHYASKTMTEAQIHYNSSEKEMLAVVYAFEKFRPYLVLSKSIVYTDHSALKYLMNKQDAKPRINIFEVCAWAEAMISKDCHEGPRGPIMCQSHRSKSVDYLSNWVNAKALPQMDARVVDMFCRFFARFRTLGASISGSWDRIFVMILFAKVMSKFGVSHRLATAYYPLTKLSSRGVQSWFETNSGKDGKLELRSIGPFHITNVFSFGTIELFSTRMVYNFKVNEFGDRVHAMDSVTKKQSASWEAPHAYPSIFFLIMVWGAARLGSAETKVATWDDLAFKLNILGWNVKHSTDIAKISRKRSKPDKHGHGKGKRIQEPGECYQRDKRHISPLIGQYPKGNDTRTMKETHQDQDYCTKRLEKEAQWL
ncbi:reverse transcriptase domain-containing protein [Tanacetum coccineum]